MNQQSFVNTNGVQTQTYNNMKYILVTSKWPNPSKPSDKKESITTTMAAACLAIN